MLEAQNTLVSIINPPVLTWCRRLSFQERQIQLCTYFLSRFEESQNRLDGRSRFLRAVYKVYVLVMIRHKKLPTVDTSQHSMGYTRRHGE